MKRPRFVVADTMDLWIETARPDLDALLRRVNLLILNDSEAREITKETSLIKAGRRIRKMGPKYVAIKKGEHGALLFGEGDQFFSCGAYPLEDIHIDEPIRGFNVIKELSSSLVAIICGAIWLSAVDRVDAKGREKDWITLDNCQLVPNN